MSFSDTVRTFGLKKIVFCVKVVLAHISILFFFSPYANGSAVWSQEHEETGGCLLSASRNNGVF